MYSVDFVIYEDVIIIVIFQSSSVKQATIIGLRSENKHKLIVLFWNRGFPNQCFQPPLN